MRIKGAEEWGYKELLKYCISPLALISSALLGTRELKLAAFSHLNAASYSSWFSSLTQSTYALLAAQKCHKHAAVGQEEQPPDTGMTWYRNSVALSHPNHRPHHEIQSASSHSPLQELLTSAKARDCPELMQTIFILPLFCQLFCSLQVSWTWVGKKLCEKWHTLVGIYVANFVHLKVNRCHSKMHRGWTPFQGSLSLLATEKALRWQRYLCFRLLSLDEPHLG